MRDETGPDRSRLVRTAQLRCHRSDAPGAVKVGLAQMQRQLAQVVSAEHQNVEGVELHFLIVFSGMQGVEIGDREHNGFPIDKQIAAAYSLARPPQPRGSDRSNRTHCV